MTVYEIRVKEQLGQHWSAWFGGLTVTNEVNGETVLTGEVVDQAALHGLLSKVQDLQLTLLSVRAVERDSPVQRGRKGRLKEHAGSKYGSTSKLSHLENSR